MKTHWIKQSYTTQMDLLTANASSEYVDKFWKDVVSHFDTGQTFCLILKALSEDKGYITLTTLQMFTSSELEICQNVIKEFVALKEDDYISSVVKIEFVYKLVSAEPNLDLSIGCNRKIHTTEKGSLLRKTSIPTSRLNGYVLPSSLNLDEWGQISWSSDKKEAFISKSQSKCDYSVKILDNIRFVKLLLDTRLILEFKDEATEGNNLGTFIRTIQNNTYYYKDFKVILMKRFIKTTNISTIKRRTPYLNTRFLTMDIETKKYNDILKATTISVYDGDSIKSSFITDFDNAEEMIKITILSLMSRKYNGYRVYLHNFSGFDSVFILKILIQLSQDVKVIMKDNKLISIRFKYGKYVIYFRDSYLLLSQSLEKLGQNIGVNKKSIFPHDFVNQEHIDVDYIGVIPDIKYFNNISEDEYQDYCAKVKGKWNYKYDSIQYCQQDVITLYQVILKFSQFIYTKYFLDLHNYPTISSLALSIYRSEDIEKYHIAKITGSTYINLKKSYTGGGVDVYVPYGEEVYRYDVNSLYPYIMKEFKMPVGSPIYFSGNIWELESKPYGFFNVEVTAPDNIKVPILQTRSKINNNTTRTISPLGNWTDMYFSEEIYNAMKYGYKFKVLSGYLFDSQYIFNDYVEDLYKMKRDNPRKSVNFTISKLLLNSLYGKFGMSPFLDSTIIMDSDKADKFYRDNNVINVIDFENGRVLITYNNFDPSNFIEEDQESETWSNINVAVASAITAYARVFMSQFKNMDNYTVYYSDTDSIDLDKPLPSEYVDNNKLGFMKLENIFKRVVYIAPKVYAALIENGEYIKIKGLKETIPFNDMLTLLNKDSKLAISQDKWYRNVSDSYIDVKKMLYTLMVTSNKRNLVYNKEGKLIGTEPITLKQKDQ